MRRFGSLVCIGLFLTAIPGFPLNAFDAHKQFEAGIGPFRLGMTPTEVNSLLPQSFGGTADLPVAKEFHSSEVRYFWKYTTQFPSPAAPGSPLESLLPLQACLGSSNSYITFLFFQNQLVRISVRCFGPNREQQAKAFADAYHLPVARSTGNIWFRKSIGHTTVEVRLSIELTAVDVFKKKSPQPPINWPEEM